jgi:hypothetical protein
MWYSFGSDEASAKNVDEDAMAAKSPRPTTIVCKHAYEAECLPKRGVPNQKLIDCCRPSALSRIGTSLNYNFESSCQLSETDEIPALWSPCPVSRVGMCDKLYRLHGNPVATVGILVVIIRMTPFRSAHLTSPTSVLSLGGRCKSTRSEVKGTILTQIWGAYI